MPAIILLLSLYAAQGIPFGLIFGSIPFLLKPHASYSQLSLFSLSSLPYALKLLVAPLVDGLVTPLPLGHRPGWIVPLLITSGSIQLLSADSFDSWVLHGRVDILCPLCFTLICLVAIQEIAVDGWSLELLSERNRGWASICQAIGPSIGYTTSFTAFLALNDAKLCEHYIWPLLSPSRSGAVISISDAVRTSAIIFLSTAFIVTVFVKFAGDKTTNNATWKETERLMKRVPRNAKVAETYSTFGKVIALQPIRKLVVVLLISKLGFSSFDSAAPLKLIDLGLNKEFIASIAVLQAITQVCGTFVLGGFVISNKPEIIFARAYVVRFFLSLFAPILVYSYSKCAGNNVMETLLYISMMSLMVMYGIVAYSLMYVPIAAFFIEISASSVTIGGSYLTLLHAAYNVGSMLPKPITLQLVDFFTLRRSCTTAQDSISSNCPITLDGYYVVSALEALFAIFAGIVIHRTLPELGNLPEKSWMPPNNEKLSAKPEQQD